MRSQSGKSDECLVTFTFIDSGQPTIQPFVTHLSSYRPLFSRLKAFEFIYVAPSSRQFGQAQAVFQQSVLGRDEGHRGSDILRYFRIRQDWEANERVPGADVVYLKNSRRRFVGNETETLYKQWASGEVRDDQLTAVWRSKLSLPLWNSEQRFTAAGYPFSREMRLKSWTQIGKRPQWVFHDEVHDQVRELTMHFDDSKGSGGRKDGDGVRSKVARSGGSDPTLCGLPAAQTPHGFGGRYRPSVREICSPSFLSPHGAALKKDSKALNHRNEGDISTWP